jgi:exodeoxyribonuclease-3
MRLMTYNILDGGQDRLPVLLEVVRAAAPDVLALQECRGFEDAQLLRHCEAALGMRALLAASDSGDHVALFARDAVWRDEQTLRDGFARAAAIATLELRGETLAVAAVHLDPYDANTRIAEVQRVLAALPRDRPAAVMGDLNAISPHDVTRMRPDLWPQRYRARHCLSSGAIDTRAIAELEAAGFIDLATRAHEPPSFTRPTQLYAGRDAPSLRLDYLFTTPELERRLAGVLAIDDARAQRASDHLPVVADIG